MEPEPEPELPKSIRSLPLELLIGINEYLPKHRDIVNFSHTCRHLRHQLSPLAYRELHLTNNKAQADAAYAVANRNGQFTQVLAVTIIIGNVVVKNGRTEYQRVLLPISAERLMAGELVPSLHTIRIRLVWRYSDWTSAKSHISYHTSTTEPRWDHFKTCLEANRCSDETMFHELYSLTMDRVWQALSPNPLVKNLCIENLSGSLPWTTGMGWSPMPTSRKLLFDLARRLESVSLTGCRLDRDAAGPEFHVPAPVNKLGSSLGNIITAFVPRGKAFRSIVLRAPEDTPLYSFWRGALGLPYQVRMASLGLQLQRLQHLELTGCIVTRYLMGLIEGLTERMETLRLIGCFAVHDPSRTPPYDGTWRNMFTRLKDMGALRRPKHIELVPSTGKKLEFGYAEFRYARWCISRSCYETCSREEQDTGRDEIAYDELMSEVRADAGIAVVGDEAA